MCLQSALSVLGNYFIVYTIMFCGLIEELFITNQLVLNNKRIIFTVYIMFQRR